MVMILFASIESAISLASIELSIKKRYYLQALSYLRLLTV